MSNQLDKKSQKQNSSLIASKNSEVVRKVMPLMNLNEDYQRRAFLEALQKFSVTEKELEDGFWGAYADHFTPSTGIEFRHIYKHVLESRENNGKVNIDMRRFH